MAEYPLVTQMQGPSIDVSLFPDAMAKGAYVGNAVKTPLQAVAEGVTQGINSYQDVQAKQAQIDQAPARQKILEQQAREAELNNQMKEVQAEATVLNKDRIIDNQSAKLEDETLKLNQDKKLREDTDLFHNEWQNTDNPLDKKKLLFGGQYSNVFANDPKAFKQAGSEVYQYMTPGEQASFNAGMLKSAASSKYDQDAQKWQIQSQHTRSNLQADPDYLYSVNAAGLTPEDGESQLVYKQHGSVQVDPTTRKVKLGKGGWAYNAPGSYDAKDSTWDVFTKDGTLIKEGASAESGKAFNANTQAQNYVNGTYKKRAIGAIDARFQGQLSKPPSQEAGMQQGPAPQQALTKEQELNTPSLSGKKQAAPTAAQVNEAAAKPKEVSPKMQSLGFIRDISVVSKGQPVLVNNDDAYEVARATVGVSKDNFVKLKPDFKKIFSVLELPKTSIFGGRTIEHAKELVTAKNSISDKMASLAYQTTPALKETYNQKAVEDHNASAEFLKQYIKNPTQMISPSDVVHGKASLSAMFGQATWDAKDLAALTPVGSPEELYRIKNVGMYDKVVDGIVGEFDRKVTVDKRSALKNKATPNAMLEIINQESQK